VNADDGLCPLTGLLNRREFERRFELERAAMRLDARHVLMLIDLQGVFRINTEHGWKAGDEVLRRVAAVIRSGVGERDTAGRLGGCHFMVLLHGVPRQRGVEIAEELGQTIAELRVDWQGAALGVAAWIGVVEIGDGSPGFADCWSAASAAARASKTEGHGSREHAGFRVCVA
jgi:diguanylate cyclase (GGDEF)-like protein